MNTNILKKCIDELSAEKPRLDYLKGMLETLYEMQDVKISPNAVLHSIKTSTNPTTEAELMDAKAKAAIAEVKRITEESTSNVK